MCWFYPTFSIPPSVNCLGFIEGSVVATSSNISAPACLRVSLILSCTTGCWLESPRPQTWTWHPGNLQNLCSIWVGGLVVVHYFASSPNYIATIEWIFARIKGTRYWTMYSHKRKGWKGLAERAWIDKSSWFCWVAKRICHCCLNQPFVMRARLRFLMWLWMKEGPLEAILISYKHDFALDRFCCWLCNDFVCLYVWDALIDLSQKFASWRSLTNLLQLK